MLFPLHLKSDWAIIETEGNNNGRVHVSTGCVQCWEMPYCISPVLFEGSRRLWDLLEGFLQPMKEISRRTSLRACEEMTSHARSLLRQKEYMFTLLKVWKWINGYFSVTALQSFETHIKNARMREGFTLHRWKHSDHNNYKKSPFYFVFEIIRMQVQL